MTVLDEGHKGQSTKAGAGIICPWFSSRGEDWYRLAKEGVGYYSSLVSQLKEDGAAEFGYGKTGALRVSRDLEALGRIERKLREQTEAEREQAKSPDYRIRKQESFSPACRRDGSHSYHRSSPR